MEETDTRPNPPEQVGAEQLVNSDDSQFMRAIKRANAVGANTTDLSAPVGAFGSAVC